MAPARICVAVLILAAATLAHGAASWTNLELKNGFTALNAAGANGLEQTPQMMVDGDRVYLRGAVTKASIAGGDIMFTLPNIPPRALAFACSAGASNQHHRIDVRHTSGDVAVAGPSPGAQVVHLDNIYFSTSAEGADGWLPVFGDNSIAASGVTFHGNDRTIPEYRKRGDLVELRGLIRGGNPLTGPLLVLPEGFRPAVGNAFTTIAHGGGGSTLRVDVYSSGLVQVAGRTANSPYAALEGIVFSTTALFTDVPLSAGFRKQPSWPQAAFRRDGDRIEVRGLIENTNGDVATGTVVAQLPLGARPAFAVVVPVVAHKGGEAHSLEVTPDGELRLRGAVGGTRYVSCDGLSFYAPSQDNVQVPLPLSAPFGASGDATGFAPPTFLRTPLDAKSEGKTVTRVFLQGMAVRDPANAPGQLLTTLPVGWRPSARVAFPAMSLEGTDQVHRVDVWPDGSVILDEEAATAPRVGLDVLDFAVDGPFAPLPLGTDYGANGGDWQTPEMVALASGRVYLRGLAKRKTGDAAAEDVVGLLPENMRPNRKVSFPVISHRSSEVHRVDVHPTGEIVVAEAFASPYVSLDGISFSTLDTEDAAYQPLLETLAEETANLMWGAVDSSWQQPSFALEGDRVFLRGLVTTMDGSALQSGQVLGQLPASMRPHFTHSFATISHSGNAVQHVEVSSDGFVTLRTARDGAVYVSLDGLHFPVRTQALWQQGWTLATTTGRELFFQDDRKLYSVTTMVMDGSTRVRSISNNNAPPEWRHPEGDLRQGVLQLGDWRLGLRNDDHYSFSHAGQADGARTPLLLRHDGAWFADRAKAVYARPGKQWRLELGSPNTRRVGDWLIGPHPSNGERLVVQHLGDDQPVLVVGADGSTTGKMPSVVSGNILAADQYWPDLGPSAIDSTVFEAFGLGGWLLGSRSDSNFAFGPAGASRPAMLVDNNGVLSVSVKGNPTDPALLLTGPVPNEVIQLKDWLIGVKSGQLVINKVGQEGRPQLTLSQDGVLKTILGTVNGRADQTWVHEDAVEGENVRLGNWIIGARRNDHFVLSRVGAARPAMLLRNDGAMWLGGVGGPTSPRYVLPEPLGCTAGGAQAVVPQLRGTDWMAGQKDGYFAFSSRLAETAGLLLRPNQGVVSGGRAPGAGDGSLRLEAGEPGAVTLGQWVVGAKGTEFFVINRPDREEAPQLVVAADGTLYARGYTNTLAPPSYTFSPELQAANPDKVVKVGDWYFGQYNEGHFVVSSAAALAAGAGPELLVRADGTMYYLPRGDSLPVQLGCALQLECEVGGGWYRDDDAEGGPTCLETTDCAAGEYVMEAPTTTTDRKCGSCVAGVGFSTVANAPSCTEATQCKVALTYETKAATATSDRTCSTCSTCPDTHRMTAECTLLADRQCEGCTVCSPDGVGDAKGFETAPCTDAAQTVCTPCTVCNSTQYQTASCTGSENTQCKMLKVCAEDEYVSSNHTMTSDRSCTKVRSCSSGEEEKLPPSPFRDRTCGPCDEGWSDVDNDGSTPCVQCSAGQYAAAGSKGSCVLHACPVGTADLDSDASTPCELCDGAEEYQNATGALVCLGATVCTEEEYELRAATTSTDRVCTALSVCGPGEEEKTPPTEVGDRRCGPCSAGTSDEDRDGSTACTPCPAGTFTPAGSQGNCTLHACLPGSADLDLDPATPCVLCNGVTEFQSNSSSTTCVNVTSCEALGKVELTPAARDRDAVCTSKPSSSSSAATAAAAGGAGGAVLVILVVLVLLLLARRRRAAKGGSSENRDTVAFENPIYDAEERMGDAAYDNAAGLGGGGAGGEGGGSDGLYSDVSMNAEGAYDNPHGFDEAGYIEGLDDAPNDAFTGGDADAGGYLDVGAHE